MSHFSFQISNELVVKYTLSDYSKQSRSEFNVLRATKTYLDECRLLFLFIQNSTS